VSPLVVDKNKMSKHGHGGGSCGHSHSHDDISDAERGNQFSLYLKIDLERLQCLNESVDGSGKNVFKPWDKKLDVEKVNILVLSLIIALSATPYYRRIRYLLHAIPSSLLVI